MDPCHRKCIHTGILHLFLGVSNPTRKDCKRRLGFWQAGRVINPTNSGICTAFLKLQSEYEIQSAISFGFTRRTDEHGPRGRSMCQNISSDRLLFVGCIWSGSGIWTGHDLVTENNGDAELYHDVRSLNKLYVADEPHRLAVVSSGGI